MTKKATINGSAVLEIKNIPTSLIVYAVHNWQLCQAYTTKRSVGNNTNPFLKGITVWLVLKAITDSGRIHDYRKQLHEIAELCKISVRTLETRLAWLKKEELIRLDGKALVMRPFHKLRQYNIDITERTDTIIYDSSKKTTLAEVLVTIALGKLKEKWNFMYNKKLSQNPNALAEVRNHLVEFGADRKRLDQDPEYLRERHLALLINTYKSEESGQSSFSLLHEHIEANPDLNARQDTLAYKLGYAAAMSFCHLKFKLIKNGLIKVAKEHVRSEYRARKDENIFHHRWLRKSKQTIWFRPDQITINYAAIFA